MDKGVNDIVVNPLKKTPAGTDDCSSVQSSAHMRVTLAQLNPHLGDIDGNLRLISEAVDQAIAEKSDLVVFSELMLTGYPPRDMLFFPDFQRKIEKALEALMSMSHDKPIRILIGAPLWVPEKQRFTNSALGLYNGDMCYVQHKSLLPYYDIFDDRRYFVASENPASFWTIGSDSANRLVPGDLGSIAPPKTSLLGVAEQEENNLKGLRPLDPTTDNFKLGILICEDAWASLEPDRYSRDPLSETMALGVDLLVVMMASPFEIGKAAQREQHFQSIAAEYTCPVVMVNQVGAHDDMLFDGSSLVVAANGHIVDALPSFYTKTKTVDLGSPHGQAEPDPCAAAGAGDRKGAALSNLFFPNHYLPTANSDLESIYGALVFSLREYVRKTGFADVVLGLSGGIDSALTAAIAVDALGAAHVTGVAMPSRYSSPDSLRDAEALAVSLGISFETIEIDPIHHLYESVMPTVFDSGLAAENIQPRIRGNLLMGLSNSRNALLLSTGNKSEIAMGYCTLYGDMCGALCVLGDVYKTEVFSLSEWRNRQGVVIPQNTINRPPSAELRPDQTDQDTLPDYAVLDAILQDYFEQRLLVSDIETRHDAATVSWIIRQFHRNEYKRRQAAVIPRLRKSAFGPGYRMPIVGMMSQ